MAILLRIGLTPIAFALVARAQTRFGDWIGGRLMGLPLTTGPFLLTVCLTSDRATAARAAAGVTSGQMAVVMFCSAYAWMALRMPPRKATVAALGMALAAVVALSALAGDWSAAIAVWVVIAASLVFWPWPRRDEQPAASDRPTSSAPMLRRAAISTLVVATTTTLVPILGARPAGVITSAPIILSIMIPSTHRESGAAGAAAMARGTIVSMAATVAFSAVLASSLPQFSAIVALLLSAAVLCVLIAATAHGERILARLSPGPARARALARP